VEEAINLAADLGVIHAVFETDSKLLEQAMNCRVPDYSQHAQVIEDLKFQLKMWFSNYEVGACSRSANYVAHELGKLGKSCIGNHTCIMYWENECPAEIAGAVSGDLAPVVG
jgi:hypothetical protein